MLDRGALEDDVVAAVVVVFFFLEACPVDLPNRTVVVNHIVDFFLCLFLFWMIIDQPSIE